MCSHRWMPIFQRNCSFSLQNIYIQVDTHLGATCFFSPQVSDTNFSLIYRAQGKGYVGSWGTWSPQYLRRAIGGHQPFWRTSSLTRLCWSAGDNLRFWDISFLYFKIRIFMCIAPFWRSMLSSIFRLNLGRKKIGRIYYLQFYNRVFRKIILAASSRSPTRRLHTVTAQKTTV